MFADWWKLLAGVLIGAIAPSLLAWGSMSAKISRNYIDIGTKLSVSTFVEYKSGNKLLLESIQGSLDRIEGKIDNKK